MDAGEQLLQMGLDHVRVGRLAQDLQQVVVTDEVEAWEKRAFLLKLRYTGYFMKKVDDSRARIISNVLLYEACMAFLVRTTNGQIFF